MLPLLLACASLPTDSADTAPPNDTIQYTTGWGWVVALAPDGTHSYWRDLSVSEPDTDPMAYMDGRYLRMQARVDRACGIRMDGALECSVLNTPPVEIRPGPYEHMEMAPGRVCVWVTDGPLECFDMQRGWAPVTEDEGLPESVRLADGSDHGLCWIDLDGAVGCTDEFTPNLEPVQQVSSAVGNMVGGLSDDGRVLPLSTKAAFPALAGTYVQFEAEGGGFALREDGTIDAQASTAHPTDANYTQLLIDDSGIQCAVQTDDVVRCWSHAAGALEGPSQDWPTVLFRDD